MDGAEVHKILWPSIEWGSLVCSCMLTASEVEEVGVGGGAIHAGAADLSRTESRRYAMALLVSFLGYDDFRHQLVAKLDTLQMLIAELTALVQTGDDAVRGPPPVGR